VTIGGVMKSERASKAGGRDWVSAGLLLVGLIGLIGSLLILAGFLQGNLRLYWFIPTLGRTRLYTAIGILVAALAVLALVSGRQRLTRFFATLTILWGLFVLAWYSWGPEPPWSDPRVGFLFRSINPPLRKMGLLTAFTMFFVGMSAWLMASRFRWALGGGLLASGGAALVAAGLASLATSALASLAFNPNIPETATQVGIQGHGALLCLSFGLLVVWYAWNETTRRTHQAPKWIPMLVLVGAMVASGMWWRILDFDRTFRIQAVLQGTLNQVAGNIQNTAREQALALGELQPAGTEDEWRQAGVEFLDRHEGYRLLIRISADSAKEWEVAARHRIPEECSSWDNTSVRNRMRQEMKDRLAVMRIGTGAGACFMSLKAEMGGGKPDAYLAGIISLNSILERLALGRSEQEWVLRLRPPAQDGGIDPGGETERQWVQQATVDVLGLQWMAELEPTKGMIANMWTYLPEASLVFGMMIGGLGSLTVHSLLAAKRKARENERVLKELDREGSERKQAERERDRVFNLSMDMIALTGYDGRFVQANPAWEGVLGYQPEGHHWPLTYYVHPEDRREAEENLERLTRGLADKVVWQSRLIDKEGRSRWILWAASSSVQDQVIAVVAKDISQIKAYELELELSAKELGHKNTSLEKALIAARQATEMKSRFLATMSHEIRTPMNGLLGMTELLLTTGLDAEQREYAELVRESGELLMRVLNDVLDFSKIEAGRMQVESKPFSVTEVLAGVEGVMRVYALKKGIDLQVRCGEDMPEEVIGDAVRLRQVLINLVDNAIKFTDHGQVRVVASRQEKQSAEVRVRFEVEDTGIGIRPDHAERLFDSFTQGDQSTTRRYGGTGLGLAISKQLVELMNGRIGYESAPGGGAIFRFTLPFQAPVDEPGALSAGA